MNFLIKVKNKRILKSPGVRKWVKETEKYLNFKLEREIEGILKAEVHDRVQVMMGKAHGRIHEL